MSADESFRLRIEQLNMTMKGGNAIKPVDVAGSASLSNIRGPKSVQNAKASGHDRASGAVGNSPVSSTLSASAPAKASGGNRTRSVTISEPVVTPRVTRSAAIPTKQSAKKGAGRETKGLPKRVSPIPSTRLFELLIDSGQAIVAVPETVEPEETVSISEETAAKPRPRPRPLKPKAPAAVEEPSDGDIAIVSVQQSASPTLPPTGQWLLKDGRR
ncbi:hypothetical protein DXG01_011498, partial [Tephrocybe rancida]